MGLDNLMFLNHFKVVTKERFINTLYIQVFSES